MNSRYFAHYIEVGTVKTSAGVRKPTMVWNGSAWVPAEVNLWDGSAWLPA